MSDTLTTADLERARAYAKLLDSSGEIEAAGWILHLADEVERGRSRELVLEASEQAAMADAIRLQDEVTNLRIALADLYATIGRLSQEAS